jgi:DNA-binding NarL/FixJ family response regulator
MSSPISSAFPESLPAAANSGSAAPAAQSAPSSNVAVDTVTLTEAEQVYQLYNQGQSVSQIASSLSLSEAAVNQYLNPSNSPG